MEDQTLKPIAFRQVMTTPFRAETGIPPNIIPVYAATTPPVPPYQPFRKIDFYPHFSSYRQLKHAFLPRNLLLQRS